MGVDFSDSSKTNSQSLKTFMKEVQGFLIWIQTVKFFTVCKLSIAGKGLIYVFGNQRWGKSLG